MKSGDLVKQFGISNQTVRRWVEQFGDYLSDDARAVNAKQSVFNADDFLVMATIKKLSTEGLSLSAIADRLAEGYRVEDISAATVGYEDGRMVPAAVVEQVVDAAGVRVELEVIKAERDKLLELLEQTQQRLDETSDQWRREKDELQKQIAELQRALGQAEGELNLRRDQEKKKRGWFG